MNTQLDLMIQDSDSDNEGKEEYQIKEIYSTISTKYISLMVQKLEEAFGLKIKNQFLTEILQDLRKVIKSLESKLIHAEEKIDGFIKIYQEAKDAQDHSMTKMKAMEFDLKRQITMTDSFEDEISKMGKAFIILFFLHLFIFSIIFIIKEIFFFWGGDCLNLNKYVNKLIH